MTIYSFGFIPDSRGLAGNREASHIIVVKKKTDAHTVDVIVDWSLIHRKRC